jgi:hypothetical protein
MITDLVRNDLSHTGPKGSVEVTELCIWPYASTSDDFYGYLKTDPQ